MKLEVGKYYRTRDGRTVGPMRARDVFGGAFWSGIGGAYHADGTHVCNPHSDIIYEWTDTPEVGPVRTVTTMRHEIIPGSYGHIWIDDVESDWVSIGMRNNALKKLDAVGLSFVELDDMVNTLTAIRDAMQANDTA